MKKYVEEKRSEIIRALGQQDYTLQDIADMFNASKTSIFRIIDSTPKGWITPWIKR
jgi:predicted DNA-binding protein YlxM (UPF0122 family)